MTRLGIATDPPSANLVRMPHSRTRALTAACLLLVAIAGVAACNPFVKQENLLELARELTPEGASVVREQYDECELFAPHQPSCAFISFRAAPDMTEARAKEVKARAKDLGRDFVDSYSGDGGTILRFERGSVVASVHLKSKRAVERCGARGCEVEGVGDAGCERG